MDWVYCLCGSLDFLWKYDDAAADEESVATYMASQIFLLLMPLLYFMYLRSFAMKRRYAKIFEILIYVYAVNFLTGIVFQLVGVCDFASYMSSRRF